MLELVNKIKEIINEEGNIEYVGIAVYLITYRQSFKVYRVNVPSNETFRTVLKNAVKEVNQDLVCYHYEEQNRPDSSQEISYIETENIPKYEQIKGVLKDNHNIGVVTKDNIKTLARESTGYVIKYMYQESTGEQILEKEIYAYFRMTKGAILTRGNNPWLRFDNEDGDNMVEVTAPQIRFDDKLVCVDIQDVMFVWSGGAFDAMLRYEEQVKIVASEALQKIEGCGLVSNFEELRNYCEGNKVMRKKLYKIGGLNKVEDISMQDFKRLKQVCGDRLKIQIDEENNKVILQQDDMKNSVAHILRIYNNESAKTLLDEELIFADRKVQM